MKKNVAKTIAKPTPLGNKNPEKVVKRKLSFVGSKVKWAQEDILMLRDYAIEHPGVRGSEAYKNIVFSLPYVPMGVIKQLSRLREEERDRCKLSGEQIPKWALPNIMLPEHLERVFAAIRQAPDGKSNELADALSKEGIPVSASMIRGYKIKIFGAEDPAEKAKRRGTV